MNELSDLWARLSGSRWARLGLNVAAGVVAVAAVVVAIWLWYGSQESNGQVALAQAVRLMQQAEAGPGPAPARDRAIEALEAVLTDFPRLSALPQAAYHLGNLRYAGGQYAQARGAYELALAKGASGTLRAMTQLGIGYTWEAEKGYDKAVTAYEAAASGPPGAIQQEALFALARVQGLSGKSDAALATYQRILKDAPSGPQGEQLRARVASLQSKATQ